MPLTTIPYYLAEGAALKKTKTQWIADTNIVPKGTICLDETSGVFGLKIGDGVHTWSNLEKLCYGDTEILTATGTIAANTNTITLPWIHDSFNEAQLLVFVGNVKQAYCSLIFDNPARMVITLPEVVLESTPYEVIKIPVNNRKLNSDQYGYDYIIDGNFDFWYEGTSQTTSGYGSDTMWQNVHVGSTKTHSRQSFSVGDVFPDGVLCPTYFSRTVVTTVAGTGNYVIKQGKLEGIANFVGKVVTLSFYAKADAAKYIQCDYLLNFGTGGSAGNGTNRYLGPINTFSLSTTWQKFQWTFTVPDLPGTTIDTTNDFLAIRFVFDAGSLAEPLYSNHFTLGQQSGTFDISSVSFVEGGTNINPIFKSLAETTREVMRQYYTTSTRGYGGERLAVWGRFNGTNVEVTLPLVVPMRMKVPVLTITNLAGMLTWFGSGAYSITALTAAGMDCTKLQGTLNAVATGGTSGHAAMLYSNNTTSKIVLDARL